MIELIVFDIDGTLTDGKITYTNNGDEIKSFDVKDGLAIATWTKKLGKKVAIITGRTSKIVERRAKDLQIDHLYQGIHNKDEIIEKILKEENITWDNVACIGDDLNDYRMLKKAKLSFCPNDAVKEIRDLVKVICKSNGGSGAGREMIEYICKENNQEEDFLNAWY
ncbi:MAG: HAD-IIIA family hydrolase [Campylobacterales bacterium]|nr:HAD-IIIA family hydrolase [Campylobacterales bacterium]NQY54724.1 HAD-IIIA family hydrolase [Campylobacteraceae bacterium]